MLTVGKLVADCGLELAAGADAAERADPLGPHLRARGPDAVALRRRAAADHRDPARTARRGSAVRRACSPTTSVAGLGLGTGFEHKRMPKALVDEAEKRGFPLFEVPYEMPFIAITERAFARWSTSSTGCSSAASRCTSASSGW